jgi:serine/threonine-protein kinase HipA
MMVATSYKPVHTVEVLIWGQTVGAIALDPRSNYYAFEYAPKFKAQEVELAPLQMPLSQGRDPFVFTSLPQETYKRLPAMLADALPDDFGNALINAWMAERGVPANNITALDRLAYMGKRGFGALEFRPLRGPSGGSSTAIELGKLINVARQAVLGQLDSDTHTKAALAQIIQVGTSAGGARAKASVAWNAQTNELRAGQFDVEDGFEHWLLKFDGVGKDKQLGTSMDYGRIEYAYYLMAVDAGISMSECRLLEENGRAHFMTKRFDRLGNVKLHMQSLCAMAHLDYKQKATHSYDQLFSTMQALNLPKADFLQALRLMVFNVLAANMDDHTKNFAFILPQGGAWRLSPAYDVTHAYSQNSEWVNQHLMSINGKFANISKSDIEAVAERYDMRKQVSPVITKTKVALARWPLFASMAGVQATEIGLISQDIDKCSASVA